MRVDGCEGGGVEGDSGDSGGKGGSRNGGGNGNSGAEGDGGEGGGQDCFGRAAVPTRWWSAVEARATRRSAVARAVETAAADTAAASAVARSAPARAPPARAPFSLNAPFKGRGARMFVESDPPQYAIGKHDLNEAISAGGALFSLLWEVLGKSGGNYSETSIEKIWGGLMIDETRCGRSNDDTEMKPKWRPARSCHTQRFARRDTNTQTDAKYPRACVRSHKLGSHASRGITCHVATCVQGTL